jgi:hypothetical protein
MATEGLDAIVMTGEVAEVIPMSTPYTVCNVMESATDETEHVAERAERLYIEVDPDSPFAT